MGMRLKPQNHVLKHKLEYMAEHCLSSHEDHQDLKLKQEEPLTDDCLRISSRNLKLKRRKYIERQWLS